MRFKEKVILVTGASRNTGVAIAALFLREGGRVCINAATPESTGWGGETLKGMGLTGFTEIPADISDTEQVNSMFDTIRQRFGRLDILVNNAVNQGTGPAFEDLSPSAFMDVIRVNLLGTFQVSLQAVRMMLKQESRGIIVNIGSFVSTRAIHNRTAYVTSKGGLDAMTRSMAIDLAPKGIRVNMVAPGYIYTDRWEKLTEEEKEIRRSTIPLTMEATTDDIAQAVAFLASDAARNICGERLVVDGGCSAQLFPGNTGK